MSNDDVEKRRQANRESYQRNREARLAKGRQWREANPDKMKQYNREWYAKNREYAKVIKQAYRDANPDKMRALVRRWYLDNKEKTIGTTRLRRTGCSPERYQELLLIQDGLCAICGHPPGKHALAADHCHTTGIIRGLLCFRCNSLIGLARESAETLLAAAKYLAKDRSTRTG